jgi:Recombination endonuclease VII
VGISKEKIEALLAKRDPWELKPYDPNEPHKYRISGKDLAELYDRQKNRCAICGEEPPYGLVIDHNHKTGFIRGLLCRRCNTGIGCFQDDVHRMLAAVEYVKTETVLRV